MMFSRLLFLCSITLTSLSAADLGLPFFHSQPSAQGQEYSLPIQTLLVLTGLSFLPTVLLMMTSFTRIVIVMALLRQALGTLQAPPNRVIIGLALFLTLFVMSPVLDKIWLEAYQPYAQQQLNFNQALDKAALQLKYFMMKQTRQKDLNLFIEISDSAVPASPEEVSLKTLVPAFVTSELKTAFQIGFIIFIPFLVIDMVVASILMAMGMMMVSPITIALPFKMMLFVLVDGWTLLVGSLVQSFYL